MFSLSSLPPGASGLDIYLPSAAASSLRFPCPSRPPSSWPWNCCESSSVLLTLTNNKEGFLFHLVNLRWDLEPQDCKPLAAGVWEPEATSQYEAGIPTLQGYTAFLLFVRLLDFRRVILVLILFYQRPNFYLALQELQSNPGQQIPKWDSSNIISLDVRFN